MRKDPFSTPRRRRGGGRDIFGETKRRRFPWGLVLLLLVLVGGGFLIWQTGPQSAWQTVQSLIPKRDDSPPAPDRDAPTVPLPLPPLAD